MTLDFALLRIRFSPPCARRTQRGSRLIPSPTAMAPCCARTPQRSWVSRSHPNPSLGWKS
eukprot:713615-Prorocentrum_minimum.AAC.2